MNGIEANLSVMVDAKVAALEQSVADRIDELKKVYQAEIEASREIIDDQMSCLVKEIDDKLAGKRKEEQNNWNENLKLSLYVK